MPDGRRSTLILWGIVGLVVLGIGGRTLLRDGGARRPGGTTPGLGAPAAAMAPQIAQPRPADAVVVDVAGAVRRPGVYRLRAGARVQEAIRRAGGAARDADLTLVNRAAKVADGQQIVVPVRASAVAPGTGAAGAGAGTGGRGPVSLNAATADQLDELDGVGPATAAKIVAWRTQHGGFASVDDLGQVPGIGPKKLAALRPQVGP